MRPSPAPPSRKLSRIGPGAAALALALAGCGGDDAGRFPALLPTQQILAEPVLPEHAAPAAASPAPTEAEAASRAEALRRRAGALSGPVIEADALARMRAAGS